MTRFQPGDEVYGECRGSCAEYAVAKEGGLAPKPANLSFEQAAAVPTSACTALQGLRDHGKVQPGQKVLINGASGGVGPFAVQIAKALGAEVTGVCSTRNVEMVRSIGADHVIDYTKEDFTKGGPRYDVIMDNVASHSLSATRRALTPDGVHVPSSGHAGMGWIIAAALTAIFVRQQGGPVRRSHEQREPARAQRTSSRPARSRRSSTERIRSSDTAEAFAYLDEGHARGKVVIAVGPGES